MICYEGAFSNVDKIKLCIKYKLCLDDFPLLRMSNVGELPWRVILGDQTQV